MSEWQYQARLCVKTYVSSHLTSVQMHDRTLHIGKASLQYENVRAAANRISWQIAYCNSHTYTATI